MKDGGNLNTTLKKFNDNTGANVSSFTVQDAGEENYQTGNRKDIVWDITTLPKTIIHIK